MPKPKQPKKTEAKHQASDPRIAPEELQKPLPTFSATPHEAKPSEATRTPQTKPESSDPFPPSFASRLEDQTDRRARQAGVSAPQGLSNREQWQWRGRSEKAGLVLPGREPDRVRQTQASTMSRALGQAGAVALKAPLTLGMEAVKGTGRMALDAAKALTLVVRAPMLVFVLIFVICIGLVIGLTMPKA